MEDEKFSFIKESRKKKPVDKRRLLAQALVVLAAAVAFGVVSSMVFAFLEPKFSQLFYPRQDPVVTIPSDVADAEGSESGGESTEDGGPFGTEPDGGSEEGAGGGESTEDGGAPAQDGGEAFGATEALSTEGQSGQPGDAPPASEREFGLEDYQKMQNQIFEIGREANRFIVTVTGIKNGTDWFSNPYESKGLSSGIIIGDNGQELLILTERRMIEDVEEVCVTFLNDAMVDATVKKYDGNTGIAVLSVPRSEVDDETMEQIAIANLGNSLSIPQGALAIAVGSPLGTNYSILSGSITSTTNTISTIDHNYKIFTTDIVGSQNGTGALINASGDVIGLVMQDYGSEDAQDTITAISISELKGVIQRLANGQDIPYIGLELTTVTEEIADEYDIPKGAFVKEVRMDSPAMAAGLQSGDVVTRMGGEDIPTVDAYENVLLTLEPEESVEVVVERQGTDGYAEISCTVEASVLE